jgi:hypothetical protein
MSVRPTLTKDLRRTAVQQHQASKGKGNYNSFDPLIPRERTFSVGKRQLDTSNEYSQAAKTPKLDSNVIFSQLKDQDSVLAEIETTLLDLNAKHESAPAPDPLLSGLLKVVSLLAKSQKNLTSAVLDSAKLSGSVASPAPITVLAPAPAPGSKKPNATPTPAPISAKETATKKVKQVLRDAEKKTVLFNLDLGKNPIMNKDSISRKVTESLVASVRSGLHDYHIGDAETVLDDILSCTKLEFLGNTTKLFYNNRNATDSRNNKMYTVPVRMDFKDRDTRFNAEIMLRKVCNVSCSVPYPRKMRALLGDIVKQGKQLQPDCFIKTKVNVENLTVEAHAKTASGWLDLGIKREIPLSIIDPSISVPEPELPSASVPDVESMQVASEGSQIS